MAEKISFQAVHHMPMVQAGDDLPGMMIQALRQSSLELLDGDVLIVAQKIVSKAEGRMVLLSTVTPSAAATALAAETDKDPRMVELILSESSEVVRKNRGVLIVRHKLGFVCANAGIDQSNISHQQGEAALLLPLDPDASAQRLRQAMEKLSGKRLGIVISDSMNRPWRLGSTGTAIGSAGITVLDDRRGQHDIYGRELHVTMINRADSMATAAMLVMGETTEKVPLALVRGADADGSDQQAAICVRPLAEDLFR